VQWPITFRLPSYTTTAQPVLGRTLCCIQTYNHYVLKLHLSRPAACSSSHIDSVSLPRQSREFLPFAFR
jgi:hypothetical protein